MKIESPSAKYFSCYQSRHKKKNNLPIAGTTNVTFMYKLMRMLFVLIKHKQSYDYNIDKI